ncbi:MAG: hypothetical protein QM426_10485 [Euryarchaeota archaeon]|nr:hypothetical protein [Euryarchaeota archaeon]
MDPDFSEEHICFGIDELKGCLNEKREAAIVWEEAGASAYSRDFMEERNKIISKTLQVYGYRKIALYGNFQHLKFLDGDIRLQLDCIHKMKAYRGFDESGQPFTYTYDIPYAIVTDYLKEPMIAKYKIEREGVYQEIGKVPMPQMWDLFEVCGVTKQIYKNYMKKKDEYFIEIGAEEKPVEDDVFSKRELKTLTRVNQAYLNLASRLVDEGQTKKRIAELSDIPVSTLNVWLSKSEEAPSLISRIQGDENNNKKFFSNPLIQM